MAKTSQKDMDWLKSTVEKLTTDEVAQMKEAFTLFDADDDGCITVKELKSTMTSLGQDPTDDEVKAMIAKVDLDNNGTLDWDEFLVMMAAQMKGEKADQAGAWAHKVPIPYVWDKSFQTLYQRIDDEHKVLFDAIWDCYGNREDLYKLIHMVASMQQHFTYEEGCMKASKHAGYARHKQVHDQYIDRLKRFTIPIKDRDIKFSMSWLTNHIKNTDFKYKGELLYNNDKELVGC